MGRSCVNGCWWVYLSGHSLCLISAVCPIFLLNPFLALFLVEGFVFGMCTCVYGDLGAATGVGPWVGGPVCTGAGTGKTGLCETKCQ